MKDGLLAEPSVRKRPRKALAYETVPVITPPPRGDTLPCDDGEPLETSWHRDAMNQLIDSLKYAWRDRADFYVGGNMFVYYSLKQKMNTDFRGPDFFVVLGADKEPMRNSWVAWEEEGRLPSVVIELVSESTASTDFGIKKELYGKTWRTAEYFCYDPVGPGLSGWRLNAKEYDPIRAKNGRLWSNALNISLGAWKGSYMGTDAIWPRFFDAEGELVPTHGEAAQANAEAERANAEAERANAKAAQANAEAERANALAAQANAEAERLRADAAEAELVALRKQLAKSKRKK